MPTALNLWGIWRNLFAEVGGYGFQHFPNGEIVGTTAFTDAAANAIRGGFRDGLVAAFCKRLHIVAGVVTVEKEHGGNGNPRGAGGAVVTTAAELIP